MAAKRHKKHKNKISGLVNSTCFNEQKSKQCPIKAAIDFSPILSFLSWIFRF
jgi:hypothetical protein